MPSKRGILRIPKNIRCHIPQRRIETAPQHTAIFAATTTAATRLPHPRIPVHSFRRPERDSPRPSAHPKALHRAARKTVAIPTFTSTLKGPTKTGTEVLRVGMTVQKGRRRCEHIETACPPHASYGATTATTLHKRRTVSSASGCASGLHPPLRDRRIRIFSEKRAPLLLHARRRTNSQMYSSAPRYAAASTERI